MVLQSFIQLLQIAQQRICKRVQFSCTPKYLGRWQLTTCPRSIDNKIDWSNEDHCGPCGERIVMKKDSNKTSP